MEERLRACKSITSFTFSSLVNHLQCREEHGRSSDHVGKSRVHEAFIGLTLRCVLAMIVVRIAFITVPIPGLLTYTTFSTRAQSLSLPIVIRPKRDAEQLCHKRNAGNGIPSALDGSMCFEPMSCDTTYLLTGCPQARARMRDSRLRVSSPSFRLTDDSWCDDDQSSTHCFSCLPPSPTQLIACW